MLLEENNKMELSRKSVDRFRWQKAFKSPSEIFKVFYAIFNKSYTVNQLWKAIYWAFIYNLFKQKQWAVAR